MRGFHADLDPERIGRPVLTATVPRLPEVVQSFHLAGDDDYLLHVAVPSASYLRDWNQPRLRPRARSARAALTGAPRQGQSAAV
ncbi:Lrp/AsnC ligand binding domain-containing protein, partial [Nostocoides australiense]|uniref:Lrp/AsnC ligand binding domain-containing protein n=1 Tax=Nostocoides australiense TaxID=99480 RepID=UPI0006614180